MKKKKLLIIAETMEGGVRRHVLDLIKGLDKEIYSIYVIYGNRVDNIFIKEIETNSSNWDMTRLKHLGREINLINDFKSFLAIYRIIKDFDPDIVHCHSSKAGALGRIAAKILNVEKIFYTPHAYSFQSVEFSNSKKKLFIFIEKFLSEKTTTKTFNVSQGERVLALSNKIDTQDKFKVIYNGIPAINFPEKYSLKRELGLPEESFIIGNNARLSDEKNPLAFMSIAKNVVKENPNIHFVYAGDGPLYDECLNFININNLNENVHLLGFRNDSEIIVNAYDMFLITSKHEGLPYSLIESMRACVPILGFTAAGVDEIVSIENGLLISDEKEASEVILRSYNNMDFSKDLIYSQFQSKFSFEKMLNDIHAMYMS